MGCDYFIHEGEDEITIKIIDYSTGNVVEELSIDSDRFEDYKVDVELEGVTSR